jgi:membrane protease YdiL (CAAX protease family)
MTEPEQPDARSTPPPATMPDGRASLPPPSAVPGRSTPPPRPGASSSPAPGQSDRPRTGGSFLTRYAGIPETGWSGLSVTVGVLIAVAVMISGTIIVAIFDPEFETTAGKDAAQLMVALSLGGTAFGFAFHDARGKLRGAFERLGLGARITLAAIGLALLAWLVYILFAAVLSPLLHPDQQDVTQELGTDKSSAISIAVAGILIVVLAPLSEELFFRGFMLASLRRSMPLWPAALIAAVVWGALHLSGGNIGVAIQLSVFGVILAWLYERSGTLWAPITAHALNNTIAFVLLLTGT